MARYASQTSVPAERSKAEIERIVASYGASGFVSGWNHSAASVMFEMRGRRVRFSLPLPGLNDKAYDRSRVGRKTAWERDCRQRWRALLLCIKAKLEAVESKIVSFDEEFMPYVVMANGCTIAEQLLPKMAAICETGRLLPLLPGPPEE